MQKLRPGTRLKSAVSDVEIMVTKAPPEELELACGGVAMLAMDAERDAGAAEGPVEGRVEMGKRYVDAGEKVELLCTKAGEGTLTLDGEALAIRTAKPLPSSD